MTTIQMLALGMPLVTAALVGLTALFVRRPWDEKKPPTVDELLDTAAPFKESRPFDEVWGEGGAERFKLWLSHNTSDTEAVRSTLRRWSETIHQSRSETVPAELLARWKSESLATQLLVGAWAIDVVSRAASERAASATEGQAPGTGNNQPRNRAPESDRS